MKTPETPLCPETPWNEMDCQCELISLVRTTIADEIHSRRDSTASKSSIQWNGAISCAEGIARGKKKP